MKIKKNPGIDAFANISRYLPLKPPDLKAGVIIQARVGSSRLPFKVVLPFDHTRSIIEILIDRLKANVKKVPLVLATTGSDDDEVLCKVASNAGIDCFRGPEEDVLERFILAAEQQGFHSIIRICADNPFLDVNGTMALLEHGDRHDYVSYRLSGNLPAIRSHLGLWGEVVSLDALKKVRKETDRKYYYEHVTNYIYEHPGKFNIAWKDAPPPVYERDDIRLTIDDETDFNLGKELMHEMRKGGMPLTVANMVSFLDGHPRFLHAMKEQIRKYHK